MQQSTKLMAGLIMRVQETGHRVEIIRGPGSVAPGGFYVDTGDLFQTAATYALDLETRQVSLYLVKDLVSEQ